MSKVSQPVVSQGRYDNPWSTWRFPSTADIARMMCSFTFGRKPDIPSENELPIQTPVFPEGEDNKVSATWLGHASILFCLDGIRTLCDPIFSDRCSPVGFAGPKRFRPPPCSVADLPEVDAVVISHTHYDHLDYQSVLDINKRFPEVEWFVPMGCAGWMRRCGCQNVQEMMWWDEKKLKKNPDVKIVFTPTQHWSGRSVMDRNKCLWGSWAVIGPQHRVWFAGDTGYCDTFKEIGEKYGPFDLAGIPIGAYHPRWFMTPQHVNPEEAVDIHMDIRSKRSVGMHWGTFMMTYEPIMEPKGKLSAALNAAGLVPQEFITVNHGQTLIFNPGSDSHMLQ